LIQLHGGGGGWMLLFSFFMSTCVVSWKNDAKMLVKIKTTSGFHSMHVDF